jgi:hypothetical protein
MAPAGIDRPNLQKGPQNVYVSILKDPQSPQATAQATALISGPSQIQRQLEGM